MLFKESGDYNIIIGNESLKFNLSGSSNLAIGNYSGWDSTGSNELYIDNLGRIDPKTEGMMYGVFNESVTAQTLFLNAKITIVCAFPINIKNEGFTFIYIDNVFNTGINKFYFDFDKSNLPILKLN